MNLYTCLEFPLRRHTDKNIVRSTSTGCVNHVLQQLTVFTWRNCSRVSLAKCNFTRKMAVSRFWAQFGGLETTYDVHLKRKNAKLGQKGPEGVRGTTFRLFPRYGGGTKISKKVGHVTPYQRLLTYFCIISFRSRSDQFACQIL